MKLEVRHLPFWGDKPHVIIRPMSTFGRYWDGPIILSSAVMVTVGGLMFSACRHLPSFREFEYYTEHDSLADVETRFLASMLLAVGFEEGVVAPYPISERFAVEYSGDLNCPTFLSQVVSQLGNELPTLLRSSAAPHVPFDGVEPRSYQLHHLPLSVDRIGGLYAQIDEADALLMRGVEALLKSRMIAMHSEFAEEANYALYLSMEVLFALVRRHLQSLGNSNPTAYDPQAFVHDLFGEEQSGQKFFEDYYGERVMVMHPENRYGTFRHAPLSHCAFHTLFEDVREVYRQMLMGGFIKPAHRSD